MKKFEFSGFIEGADVYLADPLTFEILSIMKNGKVIVTVREDKKVRTNPQNAYYWGVVVEVVKNALAHHGELFTSQEVHEELKRRFLSKITFVNGQEITRFQSSTELDFEEFWLFVSQVRQWVWDFFGFLIPEPDQDFNERFNAYKIAEKADT